VDLHAYQSVPYLLETIFKAIVLRGRFTSPRPFSSEVQINASIIADYKGSIAGHFETNYHALSSRSFV
jgi:hypothetical protein